MFQVNDVIKNIPNLHQMKIFVEGFPLNVSGLVQTHMFKFLKKYNKRSCFYCK